MLDTGRAYGYDEILELIEQDYGITPEILSKITNFPEDFIRNPKTGDPCLPNRAAQDKKLYLMDAMMFILSGFGAVEDEYLQAHMLAFEKLGIKRAAISRYVGVTETVLNQFHECPASVPPEEKYQIAVRFLAFEWFLSKRPDFYLKEDADAIPAAPDPDEVISTVTIELGINTDHKPVK